MKRKPTEWEKIFAGLNYPKYRNDPHNSITKEPNKPIKNGQKT